MTQKLLRVEGVNLTNFIDDSSDLSTVRGSGLLLLRAIEELSEEFSGRITPISTGASAGLFSVLSDRPATELLSEVRDFLSKENYGYAAFVADLVEGFEDFKEAKELVLAKNRFQQMRSPTVFIPEPNNNVDIGECHLDGLRPAVDTDRFPEGERNVSSSAKARRTFGRDQKQKFYRDMVGFDFAFVKEFETLTADSSKGNLDNKMAVIYIDGNSFGRIQDESCGTKEDLENFDCQIQTYRKNFLHDRLVKMQNDEDWQASDGIRFETLMWGGDEMLFVVPAWKGFEFITDFYSVSKDWSFASTPLTHSAGIVFCHRSAPIGRVKGLARSLADDVKDKTGRSGNYFSYETLESFDHIGRDLDTYRKTRLPKFLDDDSLKLSMVLDGKQLSDHTSFVSDFAGLKRVVPRRRLYRIAKMLISGEDQDEMKREISDLLAELDPSSRAKLGDIARLLGGPIGHPGAYPVDKFPELSLLWIHMNNLWDYIG